MAGNRKFIILVVIIGLAVGTFFFKTPAVKDEVSNIKASCQGLENKETCYGKAFALLTKSTNLQHSFQVLHELQKIEPGSRGCHFIAHSISIAETEKDPTKWREIMNNAPQDCSYGAAHGALEVYASTFPDGKVPENQIPTICDNPDTHNCTHALGHILLIINENNIPKSLSECEKLPHSDQGKFECLTGVFMERITALNLVEHGLADQSALNWPARLPELQTLCKEQTGINSAACWKEITHVALVSFNNDSQKIVDFCQTAPGQKETDECIDHALGIMAGAYNFQLSNMKPICEAKAKDPNFKNRCYVQIVNATLSTIPQEREAATTFCNSLEEKYRNSCLGVVNSRSSTAQFNVAS